MLRLYVAALCAALIATAARADDEIHHHPGQSRAVDEFYSTWTMPDNPARSCCNKMDCAAAQAKFKDGHWVAKRESDSNWRTVPSQKVETGRDSPDGRNHLCAPLGNSNPDTVYCFIPGSGG